LSPDTRHVVGQLADVRLRNVQFRRSDDYEFIAPLNYTITTSSDVVLADDLTSGKILFNAEVEWRSAEEGSTESIPGPFDLELTLEGLFMLNAVGDDEEELSAWVEFNSEHLLWPYLRAQIASLTTAAGLPPLTIFTLNVPRFEIGIDDDTPDGQETPDPLHDVASE
jgi:Preprotein translocase subunit SecB